MKKILLALLLLSLPTYAQGFAHRSNPGTPGATLPTITSTTCPGTGCVTINTSGAAAMLATITAAGACPGANCTLTFACSKDNWVTNTPILADALSGGSLSGAPASTTTAVGTFLIPTYAFPSCGVIATIYVSGTASVDLQGDPAVLPSIGATGAAAQQVQGTAAAGAAASGNPVQVGGRDGSSNIQPLSVVPNDTSAAGNSVETAPAIAKSAPAAVTAGRSEKLQMDTASGGIYDTPTPTTNAIGFSNVSISATASVSVKASAGNLYGFIANNGQATACFLQCVNSSGAGTLGTAPIISFPLPLATTSSASIISDIPLANFSTGIACGFSTAAGGASACGTASPATIIYK